MALDRQGWEVELERWLEPFLGHLSHRARRRMCPLYIAGLIGPGDRKSVQPMAARLGLGSPRPPAPLRVLWGLGCGSAGRRTAGRG